MALSKNLNLRLISAAILIPFVFGAIIAGGWIFGIYVALAFGLSCGEWVEMTSKFRQRALYIIAGLLYFAVSFTLYVQLRIDHVSGLYLVLLLMLCVWASDTGAYIAGRMIGGPKMAPNISPNKTWAGMTGAIAGSAIVFAGLVHVAPDLKGWIVNDLTTTTSFPVLLIYGGIMGYVGQIGDLLESMMKRKADIKDSGTLIPGHGGILDRIDALLLVIPIFSAIIAYGL